MGFPRVNNCCFCIDLRTGGIILGWLGVVGCALNILTSATFSNAYYDGNLYLYRENHMTVQQYIFANVIGLIVCGLFLYGIEKKRSSFLLPSLILNIIGFVFLLIIFVTFVAGYSILMSDDNIQKQHGGKFSAALVILIVCVVLNGYFIVVIYSLYKKIQEGQDHHPGVVYYAGASQDAYKV